MPLRPMLWLLVLALVAVLAIGALAQVTPTKPVTSAPGAPVTTPAAQPAPRTTLPAHPEIVVHPAAKPAPARAEHVPSKAAASAESPVGKGHGESALDFTSMLFVFMLATFIGIGVIRRVSRLLHTPLMSLTNAISAIAVVGSLMLAGGKEYPIGYKIAGAVAMFASMTNIISGFLITDRMLKMFKTRPGGKA